MDVEQPAALDDEPHLVLVVPVLGVELVQHGLEAGCLWRDVDHVGSHVATPRLHPVNLARVGGQDFLGRGVQHQRMRRLPTFVVDSDACQVRAHRFGLCEAPVLVRNPDRSHGVPSTRWHSLRDRKSTRLNSSHGYISYAVFCLKKKKKSVESQSDKLTAAHMS